MGIDGAQIKRKQVISKDSAEKETSPQEESTLKSSKLMQCPTCGKSISKNSESCPNCGEPISKKNQPNNSEKKAKTKSGCLVLLILFGLFAYLSNSSDRTTSSTTRNQVKQPSPKELAMMDTTLNFQWSKAGFGSIMEVDFTFNNASKYQIKDIEISCSDFAKSGTLIDKNKRVIFDIINAGQKKKFENFNMGFIHDQTESVSCSITDVKI